MIQRFWAAATDRVRVGVLVLLHVAAALFYFARMPSWWNPNRWPWDTTWQALPMQSLRSHLARSLWNLHSQPPLYNLYGALVNRLSSTHYLQIMYWGQVAMMAVCAGLAYLIGLSVIKNRLLAFGVALVYVALNPILLVYEPTVFYTLPCAFLLTGSAACLVFFSRTRQVKYLYGFVIGMNLVVLTRSLYHLSLLVPVLLFVGLLAGSRWKKVLLISLAISLPAAGWYVKNEVKFGFFGSSSWLGSNLWRVASAGYSPAELNRLAAQGVIDPAAAQVPAFAKPSAYVRYGFTRTSSVDVLAHDDLNNINLIAISDTYRHSSLRLIRHNPRQYLHNVYGAYRIYTTSELPKAYLIGPPEIKAHMRLGNAVMYSPALMNIVDRASGRAFPSLIFFWLPASLLVYGAYLLVSWPRWIAMLRADPVTLFCGLVVFYNVAAGCLLEYGENQRFKIEIEPLLWVFVFGVTYRALRRCARIFRQKQE